MAIVVISFTITLRLLTIISINYEATSILVLLYSRLVAVLSHCESFAKERDTIKRPFLYGL